MAPGHFTIPSRVYLSAEQRAKLDRLLREQGRALDELLTELLAAYVDGAPDPPPELDDQRARLGAQLHARRVELRRLQPQLTDPHNPPPAWLVQMATDLRQDIARIEGELA